MVDLPIRVDVISPNPLVRAGLVALVAEMRGGAVVTSAVKHHGEVEPRDVIVYDFGAVTEDEACSHLERLLEKETPLVALFYDTARSSRWARIAQVPPPTITLSVTPDELHRALESATEGREETEAGVQLPAGLTEREFRVVTLIAEGLQNRAIAEQLFISPNSVKTYVRSAYRKIGVSNRPAAILWALKHGLAAGPADAPQ